MKWQSLVLSLAGVAAMLVPAAKAEPIASFSTQLTTASLTESGRPSRSQTPQTWTGTEQYTGTIAGTYYYQIYRFAGSLFAGAPYVDISTFDPTNGSSYFIVAYANSYDLSNRGQNWLGDAGFSGNYQINDGGDFNVLLPVGDDLVLVVNSTVNGVLPNYAFDVNVDAYGDTEYGPAITPEPSSWLLATSGLFLLGGLLWRRHSLVPVVSR